MPTPIINKDPIDKRKRGPHLFESVATPKKVGALSTGQASNFGIKRRNQKET
jgi:hypothetical protein